MSERANVITHEEKCVGCFKCIAHCPVKFANKVYSKNGGSKVEVV